MSYVGIDKLKPMSPKLSAALNSVKVGDVIKYEKLSGELSNDDVDKLVEILKEDYNRIKQKD